MSKIKITNINNRVKHLEGTDTSLDNKNKNKNLIDSIVDNPWLSEKVKLKKLKKITKVVVVDDNSQ